VFLGADSYIFMDVSVLRFLFAKIRWFAIRFAIGVKNCEPGSNKRITLNIHTKGGIKMALSKCRECGNQVSTEAKTCPQCGAKVKRPMSKTKKILLGLFALLIVAGIFAPKDKDSQQKTTQTAATAPAAAPAQPPGEKPEDSTKSTAPVAEKPSKPIAGVGDEVNVGNFIYKVNGVKFSKSVGNQFAQERADGIFLLVDLTITNTSSETRLIDNALFKLQDQSNVSYEPSSEGSTALELSGAKTLFLKQCQPNIPTKGVLVFEVPNQKESYTLNLSGGFWSAKNAHVKLN